MAPRGHLQGDRFDFANFARAGKMGKPGSRIFFHPAFDLCFCGDQSIHPYLNSWVGVTFGRYDGDCRLLDFVHVREAHILVGGDEYTLLIVAVLDDSRIFDAIFWTFATYIKNLGETLDGEPSVHELLRVDRGTESVLQK
jgi:hypothetical protein